MALAPYRYKILVSNASPSPGGAINVFNVANDVALTDAQVNTLLTHLKTFYTAVGSYVYGIFTLGSRVLEFHPGDPAPRIVAATPQSQSNAVATALPPQLSGCVSWRTALAGKSYRGRTFLGPLNSNTLLGATFASGFTTAANTAAATLITNLRTATSSPWGLVVHSDHLNTDTPVLTALLDGRVDTIRSRS